MGLCLRRARVNCTPEGERESRLGNRVAMRRLFFREETLVKTGERLRLVRDFHPAIAIRFATTIFASFSSNTRSNTRADCLLRYL